MSSHVFCLFLAAFLTLQGCKQQVSGPEVSQQVWGESPAGEPVLRFTLSNGQGMKARVTNWGAILTAIEVPDRAGRIADVVLGFDSLAGYLVKHPRFGSLIGRYANRIGGARFVLDGKTHLLEANSGKNQIHGGSKGFDQVLWSAQPFQERDRSGVVFSYTSAAGEGGFPGTLAVRVTYALTNQNELIQAYHATTDEATHVNLTNHCYFNLNGCQSNIYDHLIQIEADSFTEPGVDKIPTGSLLPVAGTGLDFRSPVRLGERVTASAGGYDHNFVLRGPGDSLKKAAEAYDPESGRVLEVLTTQPGVQFFTANGLGRKYIGKKGLAYENHMGFCLETQHFPDSPNHPNFPTTVLRPGEAYAQQVVYRFSVR
jgi:aldose 1-epimerase